MENEGLASGKESGMRLNMQAVIRKIMDCLSRPFLQHLVTLVTAMLLAMSLISAALVTAFSRSGNEVAVISACRLAQEIFANTQGILSSSIFASGTLMNRHQFEQLTVMERGDFYIWKGGNVYDNTTSTDNAHRAYCSLTLRCQPTRVGWQRRRSAITGSDQGCCATTRI
jgi:hypothetical protein